MVYSIKYIKKNGDPFFWEMSACPEQEPEDIKLDSVEYYEFLGVPELPEYHGQFIQYRVYIEDEWDIENLFCKGVKLIRKYRANKIKGVLK